MPDHPSDQERFEELLAFYGSNQLPPADQEWMESYLARHPNAASLLQVDQRIREIVRTTASPLPETVRLARLLKEFHTLKPQKSWAQRIGQWFINAYRIPAPAIALAFAVLVVQSIALIGMKPEPANEIYRGTSAPCSEGIQIRIVFKLDAQQGAIVSLLRQVEATLTAGPTETNQLWVKIPDGHSGEKARDTLLRSGLVDEAILVEASGCPR